ncbi:zinc finger domain-containing protein [Microbispora rosea]
MTPIRQRFLVEAHACPMTSCAAPAGSPCRTGQGKVAVHYHTARCRLVPALASRALWRPRPSASRARSGSNCRARPRRAPNRRGTYASGTPAPPSSVSPWTPNPRHITCAFGPARFDQPLDAHPAKAQG